VSLHQASPTTARRGALERDRGGTHFAPFEPSVPAADRHGLHGKAVLVDEVLGCERRGENCATPGDHVQTRLLDRGDVGGEVSSEAPGVRRPGTGRPSSTEHHGPARERGRSGPEGTVLGGS
jgi:hypothetical protein